MLAGIGAPWWWPIGHASLARRSRLARVHAFRHAPRYRSRSFVSARISAPKFEIA
jgi:hypothetical protein